MANKSKRDSISEQEYLVERYLNHAISVDKR